MVNIEISLQRVAKYLGKFSPVIMAGGVDLVFTGQYQQKRSRRYPVYLDVPIYKVRNTKRVPYTKEAISGYMQVEVRRVIEFIDDKVKDYDLFSLYCDDVHIPLENMRNLRDCFRKTMFDKYIKIEGENYRIKGFYGDDITFSLSDENVYCEINFHLDRVEKEEKNGDSVRLSTGEARDFFHYITQDGPEFFENPVWNCFKHNLFGGADYESPFVDFSWMGWYTQVNLS